MLLASITKDLLLAARKPGEWLNPLIFFLMVGALFPLAVNPEPKFLSSIAAGVIWVTALLSTLLSLDRLFRSDVEDGSLEQILASGESLFFIALNKALVHWLTTGLPLILLSPLMAMMLYLPAQSYTALLSSLALGTPILSLLGAVGAALTAVIRQGSLLLSLLILPLCIPVLIFATSAVANAGLQMDYSGQLSLLGAMLALSISLAPLAMMAALRLYLLE